MKQDIQNKIISIDSQIEQLVKLKKQYQSLTNEDNNEKVSDSLWDKINNELADVEPYILKEITSNSDYQKYNVELNGLVQQELLMLVRDKVESKENGKELLKKQLETIKHIKTFATKEQQEEMLLFSKFKEYSKLHPNTTYEEFLTKSK